MIDYDIEKNKSFLQFTKPILKQCFFTENYNFNGIDVNNIKLKIETKATKPEVNKDKDTTSSTVSMRIFNVDSDEELQEDVPYLINVQMQADFVWHNDEKITDDLIENLLSVNAPSLISGYLRPLISSITGYSYFGSYDLPFIDFTKKK